MKVVKHGKIDGVKFLNAPSSVIGTLVLCTNCHRELIVEEGDLDNFSSFQGSNPKDKEITTEIKMNCPDCGQSISQMVYS